MEPLSPIVDPMLREHLAAHARRNEHFASTHGWAFEPGPLAVDAAWAEAVLARGLDAEAELARATGSHAARAARTTLVRLSTRTNVGRYVHPLREVTSVQSVLPLPDLFVGRLRTERSHGALSSGSLVHRRAHRFLPPVWAARHRPQLIGVRGAVLAAPDAMPPRPFAEWLVDLAAPVDEIVVRGGVVHVLARSIAEPPPVAQSLGIASTIAEHLEHAVRPRGAPGA